MSRKKRVLREWLSDILEWGDRMSLYLDTIDEQAFLSDRKTQDAVVRCLECIREASRQIVADGHAQRFPHIQFVEAYWTRNRLAHGYYDLNLHRVWKTATESAPKLVEQVRHVVGQFDS
jgi:uncharacterized protein with HEPN domain